ncbi:MULTISPECIES: protein kinase domain-containing protein [unclassified Streptomyces]|uniref:protein kinase domain-containing protein n=1 Tax=unclassified Streptomyces TaxID=2593676 RepID=UPI00093F638C|nr:protein kinase [Streptomyces sp. CB02058]
MADGAERIVGGRYRLVGHLGEGGFGRVWKAHDEALGVHVAVKEVRLPQQSGSEEERQGRVVRAAREARNAARLRDHPHIVAVHDVVVEDGTPWIVMRLVDGRSLEERLRADGPLPVPLVTETATALLKALKAAQAAGIVHRDLKPANVMLTDEGQVLLTDFGIAVHETDTRLTATGGVIGSAEYMAPERLNGSQDQAIGDLFSLGVTLYEAVEGVSPFRRDTPTATMAAVVLHDPPPMRRADPVLAAVITALLTKDPEGRPGVDSTLSMLRAAAAATTVAPAASTVPPSTVPTARVPDAPTAIDDRRSGPPTLLAEERRRIREHERPADRYRIAVYCFLALFALVCAATAISMGVASDDLYGDYDSSPDGYPYLYDPKYGDHEDIFIGLFAAQLIFGVGLVTSWVLWFARVRAFADRFAPGRLRHRPPTAVTSWFIPIGNLFLPKQIADDIWHASSPSGNGRTPAPGGLLHTWWVTWLVTLLTWPLVWTPWWGLVHGSTEHRTYEDSGGTLKYVTELDYDFGVLYWSAFTAHALALPAVVITFLFVRRLTAMQSARLRG